jgi:ferredoxin--NADP+ reductase
LGNPTKIEKIGRVLCVANKAFIGAHLFLVKALKEAGNEVVSLSCGRTKEDFYLKDEIKKECDKTYTITDDSDSDILNDFLKSLFSENKFQHVYTIGSMSMQKQVAEITKLYGIETTASVFPIMVDGTGMCGACRVTVDKITKFSCIHGPDFDAHGVDFDELMTRMRFYTPYEKISMILQEEKVV